MAAPGSLLFVLVGRDPLRHEVVDQGKVLGHVTQLDTKGGRRQGLFIGGRLACVRVGEQEQHRFEHPSEVEAFFLRGPS